MGSFLKKKANKQWVWSTRIEIEGIEMERETTKLQLSQERPEASAAPWRCAWRETALLSL